MSHRGNRIRTACAGVALLSAGCATAQGQEATPAPAPAAAAQPAACASAEHSQFDFWIGEWAVEFTGNGRPAGHSVVEKLYGDCALRENWAATSGYSGGSLNMYDRTAGLWKQTWIGSDGAISQYAGGLHDGAMVFVEAGVTDGVPYQRRMTFTPNADGSVRQYIELSNNGGPWAAEYDLTYRRVG